jgi:hypothetical protein
MTPNGFESYALRNRLLALGTVSDMRALAESGNPRAQLLIGHQTEGDIRWEWYRRAAAAGDPRAQLELGNLYEFGAPDVNRNIPEAARLYSAAAAQGYAIAQHRWGVFLYEGREGVPRNQAEGLMWLRRAAASGSEGAQDFLTYRHIPLQ